MPPYYGQHYDDVRSRMCHACGASINGAQAEIDHSRFHENMISREEAHSMSAVNWCDVGNHAFKAGVPGSQSMNGTQVDENGVSVNVRMDICPDHTQESIARKAIESIKSEANYGTPESEK